MPLTRFHARIDGLACTDGGLAPPDDGALRALLRQAGERAHAELRERFGDAVLESYGVRERLRSWTERAEPTRFGLRRGLVFAALDAFHARRIALPSTLDAVRGSAAARRRAQAWTPYLASRALEGLDESLERSLCDGAVLALLPRRWLPQRWIAEPVQASLAASPAVKRAEVRVELALPAPGGIDWVRARTRAAWTELRERLAAGEPRPVRLITRSLDPLAARHVVVWGWERGAGDELVLRVLDPARPRREERLRLSIERDDDGARDPASVLGFDGEAYSPEEPPDDGWDRFLAALGLRAPLWSIARSLRLAREAWRAALARS